MGRIYTKPLKGHKLTLTWSGEYGIESSSTASCICGWQESHSNREGCRMEYRLHLERERERLAHKEAEAERKRQEQSEIPGDTTTTDSAPEFLQQWLKMPLLMMERSGKFTKRGAYWNLHDFVLQQGRAFEPAPLPDDIEYGEVKQCFFNCFVLMSQDPERFVYCEGVGLCFIPCDHAWLWDRKHQRVVDPTWRGEWERPPLAYFGVPLRHQYVTRQVLDKGTYGVMDDWQNGFPILAHDKAKWLEANL